MEEYIQYSPSYYLIPMKSVFFYYQPLHYVSYEEIILLTLWDSDCRSVVAIVLIAGIAGAGMTGENVFTHISIQIYQRTVYH